MVQAVQTVDITRRGFLDGPWLFLFAMATAFFPRLLTALGFPSIVNFAHFSVVLFVFLYSFTQERTTAAKKLSLGIFLFLLLIIVSALLNKTGMMNTVLEWVLLAEHFLLLAALCNAQWTSKQIDVLQFGLLTYMLFHSLFGWYQFFGLGLSADDVKGVFLGSSTGHHVAGAVCLSASVYFFVEKPYDSKFLGTAIALFCLAIVFFSDSKQVIAAFLLALLLLIVYKQLTAKPGESSQMRTYFLSAVLSVGILFYIGTTIFTALQAWADITLIQQGLAQKLTVFPVTISQYDGAWNWLVGLGPGHTTGRLGLMIPQYIELLEGTDITTHAATSIINSASQGHWMSNSITGSSLWSLKFSFAGIWGDLGIVGLGIYLFGWWLVWKHICFDDLSKFLVLTVMVFGGVYNWLEEPAYMLFVVCLLGLHYLKHRLQQKQEDTIVPPSLTHGHYVHP